MTDQEHHRHAEISLLLARACADRLSESADAAERRGEDQATLRAAIAEGLATLNRLEKIVAALSPGRVLH
jgi:hypothetical protein